MKTAEEIRQISQNAQTTTQRANSVLGRIQNEMIYWAERGLFHIIHTEWDTDKETCNIVILALKNAGYKVSTEDDSPVNQENVFHLKFFIEW